MCKVKLKEMGFPKIKALWGGAKGMFNFDKAYPHAFTPYKNHHKFFIFQNFPYDTQ